MVNTPEVIRWKRSALADTDRLLGEIIAFIQEARERAEITPANFAAAGITQADGVADG